MEKDREISITKIAQMIDSSIKLMRPDLTGVGNYTDGFNDAKNYILGILKAYDKKRIEMRKNKEI